MTRIAVVLLALLMLAAVPPSASGAVTCEGTSAAQFREIGRDLMAQMPNAAPMRARWGASAQGRMYEWMGRRASGCPAGAAPTGVMPMLGAGGWRTGMMGREDGPDTWAIVAIAVALAAGILGFAAFVQSRGRPSAVA